MTPIEELRQVAFSMKHSAGAYMIPGYDGWKIAALIESVLAQLQAGETARPTFDEWWEKHGKYNALFKFEPNASPAERLGRSRELMKLAWEVSREAAPVENGLTLPEGETR